MGAKGGEQMRIYILRRTLGDVERARAQIRARGADRVVGLAAGGRVDEEALRRSGADLFVLDAVLPGQDGLALARALAPRPCVLLLPCAQNLRAPKNARFATEAELVAALDEVRGAALATPDRNALGEELLRLGFKPQTLGTRQLCRALEIALQDEGALADVRSRIYAPIAREMRRTPDSVERNIRYAIECAWVRGDLRALQSRFGYTVEAERGKPTNRAFLAQICEHLRLRRMDAQEETYPS